MIKHLHRNRAFYLTAAAGAFWLLATFAGAVQRGTY